MLNQPQCSNSIDSDVWILGEFSEVVGQYLFALTFYSVCRPLCVEVFPSQQIQETDKECDSTTGICPPGFDRDDFLKLLNRLFSVDYNTSKTGRLRDTLACAVVQSTDSVIFNEKSQSFDYIVFTIPPFVCPFHDSNSLSSISFHRIN